MVWYGVYDIMIIDTALLNWDLIKQINNLDDIRA